MRMTLSQVLRYNVCPQSPYLPDEFPEECADGCDGVAGGEFTHLASKALSRTSAKRDAAPA